MPDAATSTAMDAELGAEFRGAAATFVDVAERALVNGHSARVQSRDLEHVITAAIKLYAAKAEAEEAFPTPVSPDKVTPTEIVLVVSELLRAANISLFDLAMWYRRGERT